MRIFALLCLALVGIAQTSVAAKQEDPFESKAADVRLIIDISGSMKQNDPNNLRIPAVELLCRLMPEGSRAGIWTFGQSVNLINKLQTVDARWKEQAIASSKNINSTGLFTNIGAALEKAAADPGDNKHRKHLILLTDGMVDIDKNPAVNEKEWQRIANDLLPRLKKSSYSIHTVALSDNADTDLLRKLSLATNGASVVAHSADELMKAFLQVFDTAAPAQQLPMTGNTFNVDDSVNELTALIFRDEVGAQLELQGPDKTLFNASTAPKNVNWFRGDNYDLITFKKPAQGIWTINGAIAAGSRVTVVSDLNLQVQALPNNLFIGYQAELSMVMQEEGKTFINPEFLRLMKINGELSHTHTDGEAEHLWARDLSGSSPPVDGIYTGTLPTLDKPGTYNLTILADGKTFKREYRQRIAVRARFETEVTPVGDTAYELTIKTFDDEIDRDSVQILASLENDKHVKTPIELELTPIDYWRADIQPSTPGEYWVKVEVKGKTRSGNTFNYELAPEKMTYQVAAQTENTPKEQSPAAAPEPEVKHEEPVPAQPETKAHQGIPQWAIYAALGTLNVLIFVGGFFLYKKIMGSKSSDAILEEFSETKIAPPPPPPKAKAAPPPPPPIEEDFDETVMQVPPVEEDEPPMEDLDVGMDDDVFDEPHAPVSAPEVSETEMTSDEDIDALLAAQNEPAKEAEDDMVKAMLKAQGLDLAEHELDDAISSLIDEMDSTSNRKLAAQQETSPPPDFDDFDDFGLDDKK